MSSNFSSWRGMGLLFKMVEDFLRCRLNQRFQMRGSMLFSNPFRIPSGCTDRYRNWANPLRGCTNFEIDREGIQTLSELIGVRFSHPFKPHQSYGTHIWTVNPRIWSRKPSPSFPLFNDESGQILDLPTLYRYCPIWIQITASSISVMVLVLLPSKTKGLAYPHKPPLVSRKNPAFAGASGTGPLRFFQTDSCR